MSDGVREWRSGLTADDISIIGGCLRAAVEGPFFPDWEFSTLFGMERREVATVWSSWPQTEDAADQWRAVSGSMNNLLGYPHGRDDAWHEYIPASRDEVEALYWRIGEESGEPLDGPSVMSELLAEAGMIDLAWLPGERSDVPLAQRAAEYLYDRLLRRHVALYDYQPQILHAKLLVMDDIVCVGSCNLDRRSLHINFELLLRLQWPELAADARQWYEAALAHATPLQPVGWRKTRTLLRRLRSWLAYMLLSRVDPLVARRRFRALS